LGVGKKKKISVLRGKKSLAKDGDPESALTRKKKTTTRGGFFTDKRFKTQPQ